MFVATAITRCRAILVGTLALGVAACATTGPARSQDAPPAELSEAQAPTYADLVAMAMEADTVVLVSVEDQTAFPAERAPSVPPSEVRLYMETLVQGLLKAPRPLGESLTYVVDRSRDADGDVPDLEERRFLLFGDLSASQPGSLQLLSSDSMLPAGPRIEERTRRVLTQLAAADIPPAITGVRDVISVPGNLAGESETQMFVETATGAPVSLSVIRRPNQAPEWGISLGELVDSSATPPEPETIAWYRFACFLPRELPQDAFLQTDRASQAQAREDYAFVLAELGPCERRFT
ncbi:hypothetical protein [Aurantiacibacter poecillastricola]|uniref:hypothetical protein n=1 Tax=Aurantiacibacter poecillastricola TaxID=3064385 RepID=UPI002740009E|nr:hypothetical protein [Aurantiacibacter sp. 219JJ12-13]MDP5260354.1 hypothetical protein [Aurantiacibacter sp. 219JJ12-13]